MSANDDFFVKFGSNAKTFTEQLKRDLAPAKAEVAQLGTMLQALEHQAQKPGIQNALAHSAGRTPTPASTSGGGQALSIDTSKFMHDMDSMSGELKSMLGQIGRVVQALGKAVPGAEAFVKQQNQSAGAQARIAGGQGAYRDPATGRLVSNAAATSGQVPGAYRTGAADQAITRLLRNAEAAARRPQPLGNVTVGGLSKVQLDQAGFDRVVRAIDQLRGVVERTGVRTVAPSEHGVPAAGPAPSGARVSQSPPGQTKQTLEQREAALRRSIAELEVGNQHIQALMKQAGIVVNDEMKGLLAEQQKQQSQLKAELASVERERTGVNRSQQSQARRDSAVRGPDLPEEEYDRRKAIQQRIALPANPQAFMASIGRGAGKLGKADLTQIAKDLTGLGFNVPLSGKPNMQQLGERIVSAREAYTKTYGAETPEALQTGRRIVSDKVADHVRQLLGDINKSALEAAEEAQALEAIRTARLTGHLPKDPTEEITRVNPVGNSAIGVPRGMVKGGSYNDVFGYQQAEELLSQRRLGRASVLASRPDFNPYNFNLKQDVTGQGDEAENARRAVRALRRGTTELDELGQQYVTTAASIEHLNAYLERAKNRIARAAEGLPLNAEQLEKLKTDPQKIPQAEQEVARLRASLDSPRYRGMQDLFEDPDYKAGLHQRNISRAEIQARIDAQAGQGYVNTRDAAGQAIIGTRLAQGTKDTYIRNVPGARYNQYQQRYEFLDDQRDPSQLAELNRRSRSYQASMAKERNLQGDLDAGEPVGDKLAKVANRTENQAVAFLNELQKVFGISPSLHSIIGRGPSEANAAAEERRQAASGAVRAEAYRKLPPNSPETILGQRQEAVDATSEALAAVNKRLEAARAHAATTQQAADRALERQTAEQREVAVRRRAAEQRIFQVGTQIARLPGADLSQLGSQGPLDASGRFYRNRPGAGEGIQSRVASDLNVDLKEAQQALAALPEATSKEVAEAEQAARALAKLETEAAKAGTAFETASTRLNQAKEELRGLSSKVPAGGGGTSPAAATGGDLQSVQAQISQGQALRQQRTALNQAKKKATDAEKADIQEQLKALRAQGIPTKGDLKALRRQAADLAGGAGAGGGVPPTVRGGAGGGGFDGGQSNQILRDILTALNGIHRTIQTGVRVTGPGAKAATGEAGDATTTKSGGSRTRQTALLSEVTQAQSDDPRQRALAAAAQQRRLELLKANDVERAHGQALLEDARRAKQAAEAEQKASSITRQAAHEKLQLAQAMGLLDQNAVKEIATLARLNQEGADSVKIAEQQARAYRAVDESLARQGVGGTDRRSIGRTALNSAQPGGAQLGTRDVDEIARSARAVNGFKAVDSTMAQTVPQGGIFGEQSAFTKAMFGNSGFWSRVMSSTGTFVVRNFTAGFVFGLTNALQEVIHQGIITESTFIRVSDALEQTGRSSGNLRTELQSISSDYGTQLNDVYEVAAGLVGLFQTPHEIAGATRVVSQLELISMGALNAQESMGVLASITGAFGSELEGGVGGLEHVADVLTVIQNQLGTNIEVTSEGVGRMSGLSQQLKIDFEDTATYVAQIAKLTNQTGAAAGEQFSRILGSLQTGRARSALRKALPGSGIDELLGSGDYGKALKVLLKDWDGLSDSQKRNLTVTIAGQRQAAAFAALMNNGTKVLNTSARAHDALGEASHRAQRISATLNAEISKLGSNFQNLAQNLVRTGLLDFAGLLLKVANMVLAAMNHIFSVVNDVADTNPFLSMLKHMVAGLLGFIITMKVATAAFRGFRASMTAMRDTQVAGAGINAALSGGGVAGGVANAERVSLLAATQARLDRAALNQADAAARPAGQYGPLTAGGNFYSRGMSYNNRPLTETERGLAQIDAYGYRDPSSRFGERLSGPTDSRFGRYAGAAAAEEEALSRSAKAHLAMSSAANVASKTVGGVGRGFSALAAMGPGAQLGLVAVIAVLSAGIAQLKSDAQVAAEFRKRYKADYDEFGHAKSTITKAKDQEDEYVGPYTDAAKKNAKKTTGFWNDFLYTGVSGPLQQLKDPGKLISSRWDAFRNSGNNPLMLTAFGDYNKDSYLNQLRRGRQGYLSGDIRGNLSQLKERTNDQITKLAPPTGDDLKLVSAATGLDAKSIKAQMQGPKLTVARVRKVQTEVTNELDAMRRSIGKDGKLSDQQKQAAIAHIEALAKDSNERIAGLLLQARGIAAADLLSTDQIQQIDDIRPLLQATATSGDVNSGNKDYSKALSGLIQDTGVRKGSDMGKRLAKLAAGGLSKPQALILDQKNLDDEIKNLSAKYEVQLSNRTLTDEDFDKLKKDLTGKIQERAASVDAILQSFIDESNGIAQAAAAAGKFQGASNQLNRGLNRYEGRRDRSRETAAERAARNLTESQGAEQAAGFESQGQNLRLERSKALVQSSQRDAAYDTQIAANTYRALMHQKQIAQKAGREGPSVKAIADAKNTWIQAQQSEASLADQADIAAMTAAAAGLWNGVAIAGAQEGIALKQLQQAKARYGAGSIEATNALAQYKNSQKATIQAQDQVTTATLQATQASIPQGAAVRVAQFGVHAARVGVQLARKYGRNSAEYQGALATLYSAQQQATSAQMAVAQAQASLAQAYAEARGDAVGAARAGVRVAHAALAAARAASGGARSADVINAQAQLVQAHAAVNQAQADLVQSRVSVSVAIAEAAGNTVKAARLQLHGAVLALSAARRQAGGRNTAEVNQAKAAVVSARAAARDAALQDRLDTIDFNLQMNKITQAGAIAALQHILKTANLTKQQRRDLLLKIKGMKDEIANDQWNFADVKLPTPYEMKRFIEKQNAPLYAARQAAHDQAAGLFRNAPNNQGMSSTTHNETTIQINGADVAKVRKIVEEVVGGATKVRTTQARRR